MERYDLFGWISWGLATVGALNWGLTGAGNFNLVHSLFGRNPTLERGVYVLVGLAGVVSLFRFFEFTQRRTMPERITEKIHRAA